MVRKNDSTTVKFESTNTKSTIVRAIVTKVAAIYLRDDVIGIVGETLLGGTSVGASSVIYTSLGSVWLVGKCVGGKRYLRNVM